MYDFKNLLCDIKEGVLTIWINRPDKRNALNQELLYELDLVFQRADSDQEISGIIITGSGEKAFVAGADISEIANLNEDSAYEFAQSGKRIFDRIFHFPKPVIAAINGYALGGGFELALACHLRIADKKARFGLPELSLGLIPGYGGTFRLPLLAGYGRATQIILTGDPFNAEVAEKYGIVNWVVEDNENLLDSARIVLKRILQNSPAAIRMALPCIYGAHKEDPGKFESRSFAKCALTNDFQEGTRAFLEKRTPQFKGH